MGGGSGEGIDVEVDVEVGGEGRSGAYVVGASVMSMPRVGRHENGRKDEIKIAERKRGGAPGLEIWWWRMT